MSCHCADHKHMSQLMPGVTSSGACFWPDCKCLSPMNLPWKQEYDRLATYNSEVARGIVHTDEWKEKMAEIQKEYAEAREQLGSEGAFVR